MFSKIFFHRQNRRKQLLAVAFLLLAMWLFCLPRHLFNGVAYSTVVTDSRGQLLGARVADDGQWRFSPPDTLPEKFRKALIEFEDRQFYRHPGVNPCALTRALVQNIRGGRVVSGGSTITMQVVRMSRRKPRTIVQKLIEMAMATRLSLMCSKDSVLRLYAAHAPFGGNVVGIEAAMWRYLGHGGAELSWAEAATLAVLQNAPSSIHLAKNRERLLEKRNRLLTRLNVAGDITDDDLAMALDEPLICEPHALPQHVPHLVEYYHRTLHGMTTATHIDLSLQQRMDDMLLQWSSDYRDMGAADMAAVVVDVASGELLAYCGNADMGCEREGRWVDIARAPRSSGSVLKPLLYCAALQEGQLLPQMLVGDVPTDFGGFVPKNFDGSYSGAVEADKALALSLNIPHVQMLKDYGVGRFAQTLKACGLQSVNARRYGLSLALGGAEITLVDIARCYARMAAQYGRNITAEVAETNCEKDGTAGDDFPLTDRVALYNTFVAMREVVRPDLLDWQRAESVRQIAWKTGTSYGSRDAWAVGITPQYVVGVWVGNADGSTVPGMTGARTAGPVMFDIFSLLPPTQWFVPPTKADGASVKVCKHSGHMASRHCKEVETCLVPHAATHSRVCPYCDGGTFSLPPLMAHYYRMLHPEYAGNVEEEAASTVAAMPKMHFLYPNQGDIITLHTDEDGARGSFVCKLLHTSPTAEVFWYIDGAYIGSTKHLHQMKLSPPAGVRKIHVVDSDGMEQRVEMVVR